MSNYEYDFLVFIGRFQPFHNGHKKVIDEALGRSRRVIVLLGSSRQPKNMRNPWNDSQRAEMILNTYPGINEGIIPDRPMANSEFIIPGMQDRLICSGIMDYPYCDNDDIWIAQVQRKVQSFVAIYGTNKSKIGLIGMSKDNSSYYLKLFPKWDCINVVQKVVYNATDVRNHYFSTFPVINTNVLPDSTVTFLKKYLETTDFKYVLEEKMAVEKIRDRWKGSPYPPTFITTDAVVVQSGHILLINRKHQPGKGLLALPGGYINESERLVRWLGTGGRFVVCGGGLLVVGVLLVVVVGVGGVV